MHKLCYMCTPVIHKGQNIIKQNYKSRDSQNVLLSKLSGHISKFFDNDVFPYGSSNFAVSEGAFRKVRPLKIDHMETAVACKTVLASLKDVKSVIYVM